MCLKKHQTFEAPEAARLALCLQSCRCQSPPALEGQLKDISSHVRSDSLINLKGDGTGDTRVHDASGVVHDTASLLVLEAPDRCAQRPLYNSRDQERYHSERRSYHLATTRVLVCPALHTQRNRHRREKNKQTHTRLGLKLAEEESATTLRPADSNKKICGKRTEKNAVMRRLILGRRVGEIVWVDNGTHWGGLREKFYRKTIARGKTTMMHPPRVEDPLAITQVSVDLPRGRSSMTHDY